MDPPGPRAAAARTVAALPPLALLLSVLGAAGCGGSGRPVSVGAQVFDEGCRTCHSLVGNESLRRVGGDLVGYRLSRTDMLELVGEMPARRALSAKEIAAVSDYVLALERRAAARCPGGSCH